MGCDVGEEVLSLIINSWLWGDKYPAHYANKLFASLCRQMSDPFRFILNTNQPNLAFNRTLNFETWPIDQRDMELLYTPGCFARLRMFDKQWQRERFISPGDRIVDIDLDAVITGDLSAAFARLGEFFILQNVNSTNPCPYNGSVWMLRAGERQDVWSDFSLATYKERGVSFHAFPDDQGWFHHKFPIASAWGKDDGFYAFKKRGWPAGDELPKDARFVAFPGWRDPSKFTHIPWVKDNWRE